MKNKIIIAFILFLLFSSNISYSKTVSELVAPYLSVNLTITTNNCGFYMVQLKPNSQGVMEPQDFFEGNHIEYFKNPNYQYSGSTPPVEPITFKYYDADYTGSDKNLTYKSRIINNKWEANPNANG